MKITVTENGPYLVEGRVPIVVETIGTDRQGGSEQWVPRGNVVAASDPYALCRCGRSSNKPFCDGTHETIGFDGTETAWRGPTAARAQTFDGPAMVLEDTVELCAFARFCDTAGTIWSLIGRSDEKDARRTVREQAAHCPSGRLVVREKESGRALEPRLKPSIALVEDPAKRCSGPLWVRGGIPIASADGTTYEVRNRVTLCRCGASKNMPLCDGTHAEIGFKDGVLPSTAAEARARARR